MDGNNRSTRQNIMKHWRLSTCAVNFKSNIHRKLYSHETPKRASATTNRSRSLASHLQLPCHSSSGGGAFASSVYATNEQSAAYSPFAAASSTASLASLAAVARRLTVSPLPCSLSRAAPYPKLHLAHSASDSAETVPAGLSAPSTAHAYGGGGSSPSAGSAGGGKLAETAAYSLATSRAPSSSPSLAQLPQRPSSSGAAAAASAAAIFSSVYPSAVSRPPDLRRLSAPYFNHSTPTPPQSPSPPITNAPLSPNPRPPRLLERWSVRPHLRNRRTSTSVVRRHRSVRGGGSVGPALQRWPDLPDRHDSGCTADA